MADEVKFYNTTSGNISIKTWMANDNFVQSSSAKNPNLKAPTQTLNSLTSSHYLDVSSNYWFGIVSQNHLYNLGPLFGMGFDFLISSNSFTNVTFPSSNQSLTGNATSYYLDLSFAKIALLHDDKMRQYLALSGHYTSFSNYILNKLSLSGLAVGLDGKYAFFDVAELYLKGKYIPSTNAGLLTSSFGINGEGGLRWNISPKASIDVGYKALFYTGSATVELSGKDETGKDVKEPFNLSINDIIHGLSIGATYYF
ncbi:MAG: hypothetical protein U0457_07790 [Candidatus Sericytochromatia bacterium]